MSWVIRFFESSNNRKPVEKFFNSLDVATSAKVFRTLDLLANYGPDLGMPHSKKMTRDLYELRTRGKVEVRIFYIFRKTEIILLHAFQKASQKTPKRELETAEDCLRTL